MNEENVKNIVEIDIGKRILRLPEELTMVKLDYLKTSTNADGEVRLINRLKTGNTVVMEAGNQAFRIAKKIKAHEYESIVLNSEDMATVYSSLRKTNEEDALKLAQLAERLPREEYVKLLSER